MIIVEATAAEKDKSILKAEEFENFASKYNVIARGCNFHLLSIGWLESVEKISDPKVRLRGEAHAIGDRRGAHGRGKFSGSQETSFLFEILLTAKHYLF